jgi:RNA polymerase sigma factor (sigma-70 family)
MGEMQLKSDARLLREYAESGSESAFAELVTRHTDLVYSAALRQVSSSDLACDIAQNVFTSLARGARTLAGKLNPEASLAGWLCRCTRNLALNLRRDDFRRHSRERQAMETLHPSPETAPDWDRLCPLLDEAISGLKDADHDALVLRFFKNHDLRSVGLALGVSDDTAQKRVDRALEKLREHFAKRGITTTAAALSVVIAANAVQAAPVGLAVTISTAAALAGTAVVTTATATAVKTIAMTTLQKTLITATIAAAVGTGIYEARQASALRNQVQTLQQQQEAPLAEQIQQLQRERNDAANRLASLANEMERARGNSTELLRLRAEVTRLSGDSQELAQLKSADAQKANDPMDSATKELVAKVNLLKQRLDQRPETKIPELQYLSGQDWLRLVQEARLRQENPGDEQVLWALSTVRSAAKQQFAYWMGPSLRNYAQANGGQLPTDVSQLKPYFSFPVDDATLQRYQMLKAGNVSDLQPGELVVAEKAPVDDQYDTLWQIGLTNFQWQGTGKNRAFVKGGWPAFSAPPGAAAVGK